MKNALLIILLSISNFVFACECYNQKIEDEIKNSDQIFVGIILKKTTSDKVYNEILVKKYYKNEIGENDLEKITISTGFGGADCGIDFIEGKEYLIFSKNGETSRCRKNELIENAKYLAYVKFKYDENYRSKIGEDHGNSLNNIESDYFNKIYERKDFTNSKVEFLDEQRLISKDIFFQNYGEKYVNSFVIKLNSDEKVKHKNIDFLIVLNPKNKKLNKFYRKKFLKKIEK